MGTRFFVGPSRFKSSISADLEDLRHDRELAAKDAPTGYRLVTRERPCPVPWCCDFDGAGTCRFCGKRDGICSETAALQQLGLRLDGGMPVARHELSAVQWDLLPRVRRRGLL